MRYQHRYTAHDDLWVSEGMALAFRATTKEHQLRAVDRLNLFEDLLKSLEDLLDMHDHPDTMLICDDRIKDARAVLAEADQLT